MNEMCTSFIVRLSILFRVNTFFLIKRFVLTRAKYEFFSKYCVVASLKNKQPNGFFQNMVKLHTNQSLKRFCISRRHSLLFAFLAAFFRCLSTPPSFSSILVVMVTHKPRHLQRIQIVHKIIRVLTTFRVQYIREKT